MVKKGKREQVKREILKDISMKTHMRVKMEGKERSFPKKSNYRKKLKSRLS